MAWSKLIFGAAALYVAGAAAWVLSAGVVRDNSGVELLNVACDPTRELWQDVNAKFIERYAKETGTTLNIRQSHGGSGSQARAVIDGLPGDVVSLALWTDTDAVRKGGLMADGWENKLPNRSLPYTSTIVFVVRKGNPNNIKDWDDLARLEVGPDKKGGVITPSPKTSGNGKWSFAALWGSKVWRGKSEDEAREFVTKVYERVPVLDAAARGATMTFAQKEIGDVHLTWENEAHLEVQEANGALEIVYPPISVLAEPHVAVVDKNVDRKGTRAAAEAYMKFLYTDEAQEAIARHFHRPTSPTVFARHKKRPDGTGLFPDIRLERATTLVPSGKWDDVQKRFFTEGAIYDQIQAAGKR